MVPSKCTTTTNNIVCNINYEGALGVSDITAGGNVTIDANNTCDQNIKPGDTNANISNNGTNNITTLGTGAIVGITVAVLIAVVFIVYIVIKRRSR
tara:strand:+ start:183 stop:470 length:288 start_codon:yes stop_codon:yes gene_type:complete